MPDEIANAAASVRLQGPLTIGAAEAIRIRLLNALRTGRRTELDCDDEDAVDLSFIQILIAARRIADAQGHSLVLSARVAAAIQGVLERSGLPAEVCRNILTDDRREVGT